jgi:hypothetical protein
MTVGHGLDRREIGRRVGQNNSYLRLERRHAGTMISVATASSLLVQLAPTPAASAAVRACGMTEGSS